MSGLLASMLMAAQQPVATVSLETGNLLVTMISGLLILLFTVIGYLSVRTLKQIDANQTRLFERINDLSEDYYTLKGEHKALACKE